MGEARIQVKVGAIEFTGEGEQDWVATQLDKILDRSEQLVTFATREPESAAVANSDQGPVHQPMSADAIIAAKTLPTFLSEKNASKSQVRKFLATAIWLESKGQKRLTTSDVSRALKDSNQSKIGNAADCLNKNVAKGFCEKDGKQFFVTQEGRNSL